MLFNWVDDMGEGEVGVYCVRVGFGFVDVLR